MFVSKGKLLLADDSVTIQKVVNLTFADEGVEVVTAGNGDAAMQMIIESRPDIVLADVNMPGLNGYQVCERLRQSDSTKDIPVLLLVGSFEPFDEDEAKRVGASGFITKPFQSIRLLISQVSELLEMSAPEPPAAEPEGEKSEELWSEAKTEEPQTSDIDDLYHQSFGDTVEMPRAEPETEELVDAGMDDEIIETTYVSQPEAGGTANESEEFTITSPFEERVTNETEYSEPDRPEVLSQELEATPDDKLEPSFEETQEMPDYDPNRVVAWSKPPAEEESRANFDPTAAASFHQQRSDSFALIDDDLLELPKGGPAAPPPVSGGGSPQVVTLSPEQIDMIVEKVIERMSQTH